jgi:hypothetical protein
MLLGGLALTGCSMTPTAAPTAAPANKVQGRAMGGQLPVAFGTVQLYATGTSGYGSASTALITSASAAANSAAYPVQTDANGNFNITGDYACPTPSSTPVYLVITGGNPGNGGSVVNSNLALMVALGPCIGLGNYSFLNVSELSTVASVWSLAPFMSAIDHIGTSSTNATGITLAMAAVNKIYNINTGAVGGPALPSGATLPVDEINGLADILASCVNSTGGVATDTSTNCGKLFSYATPGSTAPTDTVTAAMNIAQNPSLNAGFLWNLIGGIGSSVFPTAVAQPAAWTIAINYTGGTMSTPSGIANDASGNIWVANAGNNSVTQLSNAGAGQNFSSVSLNSPSSIAIDSSGNAWVTNYGNNTLTQLTSTGSTGVVTTGNGLSAPKGVSFDSLGNIWVASSGSVSSFTSSGTAIGSYAVSSVTAPVGLAINPQ